MCLFCTRLKNKLCNYLVEEMISIFRLPSLITVLPEITPDKARSESHLYFFIYKYLSIHLASQKSHNYMLSGNKQVKFPAILLIAGPDSGFLSPVKSRTLMCVHVTALI